jgi:hypothetical protein
MLFYLFLSNTIFSKQEQLFILIQLLIITVLVPILFYFVLKSTGKISSAMSPSLSERRIPLVIHSFLIILLVKRTIVLARYPEFHFFLLGTLLSTLIALLLTFVKTKASIHMIGISALTVFIIGMNLHDHTQNTYLIAFLILMNGVVASSRIEMGAHNVKELIIGTLIGGIPQMLLLYLWL